jgi:hypothetical protein
MNDEKKNIDRMIRRLNNIKNHIVRDNEIRTIINRKKDFKDYIKEENRNIPILDKCNVLVVGGGPSGLSAAVSAARSGVDVILMEKFGCFGGVITTVGMETIAWYRYEGTIDSEGIGIEMERMADKMGGTIKFPYNDSECLDAEYFKYVADKLVLDNNIRPYLHIYAVEVIMEDNIIKGVITESKSGRMAILADRVIDCTGDADIAYLAGNDCSILSKAERMSVTSVINCAGVNKEKFLDYASKKKATYADWGDDWTQEASEDNKKLLSPYLSKEFDKAKEMNVIPKDSNINGSWSTITDEGEAKNLNLVHIRNIDATNVKDLTKAEMEGRKEGLNAIAALKATVPGFENAKLRNYGMTLGVRDTRKIVGKYNLTKNDVMNQAKFNDTIGIFPEFIDGYSILTLPTSGRYFQVPYRCLIPDKIDNLLVAGRCVAGDKTSHAAMRNMMACTVTGQGAGVAAAISFKNNKNTQEIDIKLIQEELLKQKVRLY